MLEQFLTVVSYVVPIVAITVICAIVATFLKNSLLGESNIQHMNVIGSGNNNIQSGSTTHTLTKCKYCGATQ